MLTIAAFLIGLWFLGLMLSVTLGGMIHLLFVAGLVLALTKIIPRSIASRTRATIKTRDDYLRLRKGQGKGGKSRVISGTGISAS